MNRNILLVLIFAFLSACNPAKKESLKQLELLTQKFDSLSAEYNAIEWSYFQEVKTTIDSQVIVLNEHMEKRSMIDDTYVQYFGPYSTINKILSRVLNKRREPIEKELAYTHEQLVNLKYDIKKNVVTNADTIVMYIQQEMAAVNKLQMQVSALQNTLKKQELAYEELHAKVDSLIKTLVKK